MNWTENDNIYWQTVKDKTTDHWLEVEDPKGWRYAVAKWDGCIQYHRYFNTPRGMNANNDEEADNLHICDIDEEIARLQALKQIAVKWFNRRKRSEYWQAGTVEADAAHVAMLPGGNNELDRDDTR